MAVRLNGSTSGYAELDAPATAGNNTIRLPTGNGSAGNILGGDGAGNLSWVGGRLVVETSKVTTSGTNIDFTGIPNWAKRITVAIDQVSTSGTSGVEIRIGTSAGIEATGYAGSVTSISGGNVCAVAAISTGFTVLGTTAAASRSGLLTLVNVTGNTWVASGAFADGGQGGTTHGTKTLAGVLDRVRLGTQNGTDAFDAGSVNILYEG